MRVGGWGLHSFGQCPRSQRCAIVSTPFGKREDTGRALRDDFPDLPILIVGECAAFPDVQIRVTVLRKDEDVRTPGHAVAVLDATFRGLGWVELTVLSVARETIGRRGREVRIAVLPEQEGLGEGEQNGLGGRVGPPRRSSGPLTRASDLSRRRELLRPRSGRRASGRRNRRVWEC